MSALPALEISGDDSELKTSPENLTSKGTEVLETVTDASKNVLRDVSITRFDSSISANAEENSGKIGKYNMNMKINTMSESSSKGEGAENGESEVVPNTSNGCGGKTTSVLKPSPSVGMSLENLLEVPIGGSGKNSGSENGSAMSMIDEAWEQLSKSYVYFKGQRVGTLAAIDTGSETLNYNQVRYSMVQTHTFHTHAYTYKFKIFKQ